MYDFREHINYLAEKLKAEPFLEDMEEGEVQLLVNGFTVKLTEGVIPSSFKFEVEIGQFTQKPKTQILDELVCANFLGVNTAGCTFYMNDEEILGLRATSTPQTSPQENWEWFNRLITVAEEWNNNKAIQWKEFHAFNKPNQ